jgi:CheY-like chemotaxis protein
MRKRLLYVEDDFLNRLVMEQYLKDHYTIDSVATSTECLDKILTNVYDGFLLDINLGHNDIDGMLLLSRIQAIIPDSKAIFIAITAYVEDSDCAAFRAHGFHLCHPKPVERERLIDELRQLLD